jgi:Dolichyl-phosphate-mannose-protein mannosyltransferase
LICGLGIVFLVGLVGMVLALQGWRSRAPAFDMVTYFNSAEALLKTGTPARYGDVSSYRAFAPPGTTWLLAPGMLLLDDPRLYEKLGSALLHVATLVGVFLLARASLGIWCAYLSVVLYGLSGLGLSFAGSLWAIGHPAFYVWLAYFGVEWVARRDAKYLAAAIVVWTVGMYVDMAIAPAGFTLPALWLIYRPPLLSRYHLLTIGLTLAVWYPYFQFERSRAFADLRSLVLLRPIPSPNPKDAWCNPDLSLASWSGSATPARLETHTLPETRRDQRGVFHRVVSRGHRLGTGLLANFKEVSPGSLSSLVMLLLALSTVLLSAGAVVRPRSALGAWLMPRAAMPVVSAESAKTGAMVVSLMVPWLILLVVAEVGRPERFFWIWPLQAIALAGFATQILPRLRLPVVVLALCQVALVAAVVVPPSQTQLQRWLRDGWAGPDPEEVRVVDFVAAQLRAEGATGAAIGYKLYIYPFMATYHIIDSIYKVGAEFDLLFKYRHGIVNRDQCGEGVSPTDKYRIVQTRPKKGEDEPRQYIQVPEDNRFRLLWRFDLYEVFKRQ